MIKFTAQELKRLSATTSAQGTCETDKKLTLTIISILKNKKNAKKISRSNEKEMIMKNSHEIPKPADLIP